MGVSVTITYMLRLTNNQPAVTDLWPDHGVTAEMWEPAARILKQRGYVPRPPLSDPRPSLADMNTRGSYEVSPPVADPGTRPLPPSAVPYVHGVKQANGHRVPSTHETDGTRARLNGCDVVKARPLHVMVLDHMSLRVLNGLHCIHDLCLSLPPT
jgi:hypothetical protein